MRALAVWLLLAGLAVAGDPPADDPQALAAELLAALDVRATVESSLDMMKQMHLDQFIRYQPASADEIQALDQQQRVMELISSEMAWDRVKDRFAAIYAATFTLDEMRGLIVFFKTPLGRAYVQKSPLIMEKTMDLNQQIMMELAPRIERILGPGGPAAPAAPFEMRP